MNPSAPPSYSAPFAFLLRALCVKAFAVAVAFAFLSAPAQAQTDIYRQIVIPEALFLQPNIPVGPKLYSTQQITKDIRIERLSFATQYGTRVPAIAYVPAHINGKAPGILIVAGHGGDKTSWYEVYAGLLYASAGAVVLTYDPAGEDERNPTHASDTRLHDAPTKLQHPERIGGLMIQDVLQAERYLGERPNVDPKRIAILAYSMGTFHAAIATAIARERTHALILSAGGNLDGPNQYWETGNKLNCQVAPYKALNAAMQGHAGDLLYQHIDQFTSTLIMNGTADGLITKFNEQQPWFDALRDRIHNPQLSGEHLPEIIFYKDVGHRPSFVNRDAALWLHHQLHFPNWTDAQINAFPTITAHRWSIANHVPINKPYDTEASEGGVEALDLHLPGIPRAQLQAIPEALWQSDRALFTFDGWLTHALAAESTAAAPVQSKHP
jgi:dienelactone hydrolase